MKNISLLRFIVFGLVLAGIFAVATPAAAKLKAIANFYVWDDNELAFKSSIVDLFLDGSETHVIHELGFDNQVYDPNDGGTTQEVCDFIADLQADGDPSFLELCPPVTQPTGDGQFAGVLQLAIPYDDDDGARAFEFSIDWGLIDCDLNEDNAWNNTDLTYNTLVNYAGGAPYLPSWDIFNDPVVGHDQDDFFKILAIDSLTPCSNATCANELITTIYLDLDINGDNALTAAGDGTPVDASGQLAGGRVCFFARITPILWPTNPATPIWQGNPQARFSAGGGDKTTNFNIFGPTAITLEQLAAQSPGGIHPVIWLGIFVLLAGVAVVLIRESRGRGIR